MKTKEEEEEEEKGEKKRSDSSSLSRSLAPLSSGSKACCSSGWSFEKRKTDKNADIYFFAFLFVKRRFLAMFCLHTFARSGIDQRANSVANSRVWEGECRQEKYISLGVASQTITLHIILEARSKN